MVAASGTHEKYARSRMLPDELWTVIIRILVAEGDACALANFSQACRYFRFLVTDFKPAYEVCTRGLDIDIRPLVFLFSFKFHFLFFDFLIFYLN